jgi:hypothetical protein
MKRPIGLILSAIVLSLTALFLLLLTALMVFAGIHVRNQPSSFVVPSAGPSALPHLLTYLMLAVSVFYIILTVWAILTVIGILRLRSWGRYSILIIGGGLSALGLIAALFTLLGRTTFSAQPTQPLLDPHIMSAVFLVMTVFYLFIAAIGIWWLAYFNLRPIRNLFNSPAPAQTYYAPLSPEAYGTTRTLNPPVDPSNGFFSSPEHTPTAIKFVGWFLLIGAILCLPLVFLPIPAFLLGFIIPVRTSHFLFLAIFLIAAYIGYGLLKLRNSARLATIVFLCFGLLNSAISLLPWYQNRFREYIAQFMAKFTAMIPTIPGQPTPIYTDPTSTIIFNAVVVIAINIYVLWLLRRHRTAFNPPPPLPDCAAPTSN